MKILLCDDERDITDGLATLLASEEITAIEANSAAEAITLLESESFDLVICDYMMPLGNGDLVMNFVVKNNIPTKFVFFSAHIDRFEITNPDITIVPKPDFEVLIEITNDMIPVSSGNL